MLALGRRTQSPSASGRTLWRRSRISDGSSILTRAWPDPTAYVVDDEALKLVFESVAIMGW